jgi:pSer/pThr/pTyr-binding forkhead associated (FHA) protein
MNCSNCGTRVPEGHSFCGQCGTPAEVSEKANRQTRQFSALMTPGRARLTVIQGNGLMPGMSYHLNATRHPVGRVQGVILFEQDPYVSPAHGELAYDGGRLFLTTESSTNGAFVRLREKTALASGTSFMLGQQVFTFEALDANRPAPAADGTRTYVSPLGDARMRLLHVLEGGIPGRARTFKGEEVTFGRQGCTFNFPDDEHISRKHARLFREGDRWLLEDLASRNGTYLKPQGRAELKHGDYVFLGKQLLRVEFNP